MWQDRSLPGHTSVRETGRKEERISHSASVRIYGTDANSKTFDLSVSTLNVSRGGALLANVPVPLRVGEVLGIRIGAEKARFRVQWLTNTGGSSHAQVGVQCLETSKNVFGVEARTSNVTIESRARIRRRPVGLDDDRSEQRLMPRYRCDWGVQLRQDGSHVGLWARCTDISEGGCYVASRSPLPVDTRIVLTLFVQPDSLDLPAVVRTMYPAIGMGVQFLFANPEEQERVRLFVTNSFAQSPSSVPQPATPAAAAPTQDPHAKEFQELEQAVSNLRQWAATGELTEDQRLAVDQVVRSVRQQLNSTRKRIEEEG